MPEIKLYYYYYYYVPEFTYSVGIMLGDCLRSVLFIVYLANALTTLETEHSCPRQLAHETPIQLLDHMYAEHPGVAPLPQCDMEHSFTVNAKYADDMTYIKV